MLRGIVKDIRVPRSLLCLKLTRETAKLGPPKAAAHVEESYIGIPCWCGEVFPPLPIVNPHPPPHIKYSHYGRL